MENNYFSTKFNELDHKTKLLLDESTDIMNKLKTEDLNEAELFNTLIRLDEIKSELMTCSNEMTKLKIYLIKSMKRSN